MADKPADLLVRLRRGLSAIFLVRRSRGGLEGLPAVLLAGLTHLKSQEQICPLSHIVGEINL